MSFWNNLGNFMGNWCEGIHQIKELMCQENKDIRKLIEENKCSVEDFTKMAEKHRVKRIEKYNELWGNDKMNVTPFHQHQIEQGNDAVLEIQLSTPKKNIRLRVSKIQPQLLIQIIKELNLKPQSNDF